MLWNNAGYGVYGSVEDVPLEEGRKEFEVNLFGLAAMTRKVVPFMRERRSGTIINTSSMGGKMYFPLGAWYHASKHAVEGFSDSLRLELKPFNIDVVILEPGMIATEFSDVVLRGMSGLSEQSPYQDMMTRFADGAKKTGSNGMSKASVIADTLSEIVKSKRPKTIASI